MSIIREALTNDILERYDNEEYWDEEVGMEAAREVIALPYDEFVSEVMEMEVYEMNLLYRVLESECSHMNDSDKRKGDYVKKFNYLKEIK